MADDEQVPALTPTPILSPAELADLALRLATRIPAVRDANVVELIQVLEQLRRQVADGARPPEAGPG